MRPTCCWYWRRWEGEGWKYLFYFCVRERNGKCWSHFVLIILTFPLSLLSFSFATNSFSIHRRTSANFSRSNKYAFSTSPHTTKRSSISQVTFLTWSRYLDDFGTPTSLNRQWSIFFLSLSNKTISSLVLPSHLSLALSPLTSQFSLSPLYLYHLAEIHHLRQEVLIELLKIPTPKFIEEMEKENLSDPSYLRFVGKESQFWIYSEFGLYFQNMIFSFVFVKIYLAILLTYLSLCTHNHPYLPQGPSTLKLGQYILHSSSRTQLNTFLQIWGNLLEWRSFRTSDLYWTGKWSTHISSSWEEARFILSSLFHSLSQTFTRIRTLHLFISTVSAFISLLRPSSISPLLFYACLPLTYSPPSYFLGLLSYVRQRNEGIWKENRRNLWPLHKHIHGPPLLHLLRLTPPNPFLFRVNLPFKGSGQVSCRFNWDFYSEISFQVSFGGPKDGLRAFFVPKSDVIHRHPSVGCGGRV